MSRCPTSPVPQVVSIDWMSCKAYYFEDSHVQIINTRLAKKDLPRYSQKEVAPSAQSAGEIRSGHLPLFEALQMSKLSIFIKKTRVTISSHPRFVFFIALLYAKNPFA